ncbi:MAG: flagellar basal body L-ring protein FlgH [Deltaproteobacteria bacterium]|nr:flagellar basal body L-ring protein FlgH [Deltaproteobacteria bacterium]
MRAVDIVLALTVFAGACGGVNHIGKYTPKQRDYKPPVDLTARAADTTNGSLFSSAHSGSYLFADQRAMRAGDILTINVLEEANAQRGAKTELTREGSAELDIASFLGLVKLLGDTLDDKLLEGAQKTDFLGKGETMRSDHVRATVPATVREVLPNGNLFIEGHRVILVNEEEHHFYVSGVIRPVDILDDNSVDSARIADAEIEFTGRGVISEKQSPGWLSRALDVVAPF